MPDPQVLYVVTAVVVLGLVAWVIVVLARPEKKSEADEASALPPKPSADAPKAADAPKIEVKVNLPDRQKPWLHSHAEIHDEQVGVAGPRSGLPGETEEDDEPTGPNALILVTAVGRTDPGLKRKHNEDAYAILEDHHLFVIADGMGRHAAGEVASQLCVDAITEAFRTGDLRAAAGAAAAEAGGAAARRDPRRQRANPGRGARRTRRTPGMGTTVVSAYFSPNNQRVYIAHVGDSRCYRLRGQKLTQLTTDHTLGAAGIQGKSGRCAQPRGRRRGRTSRSTSRWSRRCPATSICSARTA